MNEEIMKMIDETANEMQEVSEKFQNVDWSRVPIAHLAKFKYEVNTANMYLDLYVRNMKKAVKTGREMLTMDAMYKTNYREERENDIRQG